MSTEPTPSIRGRKRISKNVTPAFHAGVRHGKHFCRIFDCNVDHESMLDFALEMWIRADEGAPEPDDGNAEYTRLAVDRLEKMFNTDKNRPGKPKFFKEMLRDAASGPSFRSDYGDGLGEGASQARSDDIAALKGLPMIFTTRFPSARLGWSNPTCKEILTTPTVKAKLEDGDEADELYHQLCSRETDAHANELYQGLFLNSTFPTDPANPYQGFLGGDMFIASLKIIFTGPSSATGGPGSGRRSKSASNGMTKLTAASLAYIAMLLRFVLANPGCDWYTIPEDSDQPDYRYNYLTLYYQIMDFLEAPDFKSEVDDIFQELNRKVFPHTNRRTRTINLSASGSNSIRGMLASARRARQARQAEGNWPNHNAPPA